MNASARHRYILLSALTYLVLALLWIFLSDRLLSAFMDVESAVWLSTAKGVFFVVVSAAAFYFVLHAVPPDGQQSPQPLLDAMMVRPWPCWLDYGFAVLLVVLMLVVRANLSVDFAQRPMMLLFMLPILLAALLGGFGPGLTATLTAAGSTAYYLIPPIHSFFIAGEHDVFQWSLLIVDGLTISLISEAMHRSRRRGQAGLRQLHAANSALAASEERFRQLFDNAPVAMALIGRDGAILARNHRVERLFGYNADEIPTLAAWRQRAFPDPDIGARAQAAWNAALSGTGGGQALLDSGEEYRMTCKNGAERIVAATSIALPEGLLLALLDVTARRQAESRLRLWAESFEQARLGLVIADARSNTVIAVNPAFARQRGYERSEMTGMRLRQLFPPDCDADVNRIFAALNVSNHSVFETNHIARDGRVFPVLLDVTVLRDEHGQPINRVAYALDITDRKQAEQQLAAAMEQQRQARIAALNQMQDANAARRQAETALAALRESEERLQLFIDHAPASLAMFDRDMRYLAVSRRWLDDFSLADGNILGRCHYDVFPEIGEAWKAVHQRALAGEVVRSDDDRFERLDGSVQWLRWEVRPWREVNGAVGGLVIFSEDVTRQKEATLALRKSEARYRLVSENVSDVVWLFDLDVGRLAYVSPSVERLLGYTVAEAMQLSLKETLSPADRVLDFAFGDAGVRTQTREVNQRRKDGSIVPTETAATLITDAEGRVTHIQGVTRDITERKQAEQEIHRLNVDLERRVVERTAELAAANSELDAFAYAVSHDLRAPLRAMNGFSQAIIEDYGDALAPEAKMYLDQIIIGSRKMGELIDGLLTLSRSTRGQLQLDLVDLSAMAARQLETLALESPRRQAIWRVEPGLVVRGDAAMLEVALYNLLANAWKYTSRREEAIIRVYGETNGGQRRVCIADNGAGFDAAHAGKLFQPFQRLHRQEEFTGIGIGLATVQRIIHRHGGTIEATGEKDQGATFCFSLPCIEEPPSEAA
jgi:PAS domain S-box-containing protein